MAFVESTRRRRFDVALGVFVALFLLVSSAVAAPAAKKPTAKTPSPDAACFDNYELAQVHRRAGRLVEARAAARACRASSCPMEVASECASWESQISGEVPSALLAARREDGSDAPDIIVEIDGVVRDGALAGHPIELDPGEHTVRFRGPNGFDEERRVVMSVGERNRSIAVRVPSAAPVEPVREAPSRFTPAVITAGAVGLAGFAVMTVGAVLALDAKAKLDDCKPGCAQSDVDGARSWQLMADIGLGVGLVGTGTAAALYLWGSPAEPQKASAVWNLSPTSGGAFASVRGIF